MKSDAEAFAEIMRKLTPEVMRETVNRAGLYLVTFEILKLQVVTETKSFFGAGPGDRSGYKSEVLSLAPKKSPFDGSVCWLEKVGAISSEEGDALIAIRNHRNEIAHELPNLLLSPDHGLSYENLSRCRELTNKLARWWGPVWAGCDPQFDGQNITPDDVEPMISTVLDLVWQAFPEVSEEVDQSDSRANNLLELRFQRVARVALPWPSRYTAANINKKRSLGQDIAGEPRPT
jgi:hypothetical protein